MTINTTAEQIDSLNILGKTIDGIKCQAYQRYHDLVFVMRNNAPTRVFYADGITDQPKPYAIEQETVINVQFTQNLTLVIFQTKNTTHFRDQSNEAIKGTDQWKDYYLEPISQSFYRKGNQDKWYDIQGYPLKSQFLTKDQTLISIQGKTSRKALFFRDQILYTDPKEHMVQVGKVVFDIHLNLLSFLGKKITGIGQHNIKFANGDIYQEVYLGLEQRGFINTGDYRPLLVQGNTIHSIEMAQTIEGHTFYILHSSDKPYTSIDTPINVLMHENNVLEVNFETAIKLKTQHIVQVKSKSKHFYFDILSNSPFDPLDRNVPILDIEYSGVSLQNHRLYNITYPQKKLVYNTSTQQEFTVGNDELVPESVTPCPGFETYFYYAQIGGIQKLCNRTTNEIIQLESSIEIRTLLDSSDQKLINFHSTANEELVLDLRYGFDKLQLAKVGTFKVKKTVGPALILGDHIVQNVSMETLGGAIPRVIQLNTPDLTVFQLPQELKTDAEQSNPSVFAGNIITEIETDDPVKIDDKVFYHARFLSYFKEPKSVILQKENGRPLQLEGLGHRNELVQSFDSATLTKKYFLSDHRILRVRTLSENLKDNHLLFSFKTMSSWLPFYDTYLPILKDIIDFEKNQKWEYHLFELRNLDNDKEYIAVEQKSPYRILADKTKSIYRPRIVKSKEIVLRSPEEISTLRRFFSNPGHLVEIG